MNEQALDAQLVSRRSPQARDALRLAARRYFNQIWADRRLAIPAFLAPAVGNVLIFYIPPLIVARIIDVLIDEGTMSASRVAPHIAAFGLVWLAGEALWRLGIHFLNRTDANGIEQLSTSGMDELLEKDVVFFHDHFGGSLTKRIVSYAMKYEPFVDTLAFNVVGEALPLLFAAVILWRYSPWMVVTMVGMSVLIACAVFPLIRRRQVLVDRREAASAVVAGHVADTISNMDAVRAHTAELRESDAHRRNVVEQRKLALRSWDFHNLYIDGATAPLSVAMNVIGLILAIELGGDRDVEAVFITFTYFGQATRLLFNFNQIYRNLESSLTEAAQFTELVLEGPDVVDPDEPIDLAPVDASVRFDRVEFRHRDSQSPLFDGLDLEIPSGEKVGFVGRSGGGKTTLTRLLLRMMDIDAGSITVGGQDIRELTQADLRSQLAYVPQDPVMFHRSLHDNIAFGRPGATRDDVERAARLAHAEGFIDELASGYDTLVGERGVKLSGGQRQRVAIARAILRDAPILILDEATSALDSESEMFVQDALLQLMQDRTALVVAHRLSTLRRMDRLIVIDDGRIIETGTHDELLAVGGVYAQLWNRQSGSFLLADPT